MKKRSSLNISFNDVEANNDDESVALTSTRRRPILDENEDGDTAAEACMRMTSVMPDMTHQKTASTLSATVYLAKSAVGMAVLGLPYALIKTGVLLGVVLLIAFGFIAAIGNWLMFLVAHKSQELEPNEPVNYYSVANQTYPSMKVTIDGLICFSRFITQIGYLIIVSTFMMSLFPTISSNVLANQIIFIVIITFFYTALIFLPIYHKYAWIFNVFSLVGSGYVIGLMAVLAITSGELGSSKEVKMFTTSPMDILGAIDVFACSVFAHDLAYEVFNTMKTRTNKSYAIVSLGSTVLPTIVYCLSAPIATVHLFPNISSDANAISDYPDSIAIKIAKVALTIVNLTALPLQVHPSKTSLLTIFNFLNNKFGKPLMSKVWTFFFIVSTSGVACFVQELDIIFALLGILVSFPVIFTLPALSYLKLFPRGGVNWIISWFMLVTGIILIPICFTIFLIGFFKK
eukprot:GHVL01042348.1.p1 GENE.GHVL01042348.1~~GHVL01042348.1.p1  ORF type:complete len:459 (+),score=37.38 GHVL01042348.1:47-1423(+)